MVNDIQAKTLEIATKHKPKHMYQAITATCCHRLPASFPMAGDPGADLPGTEATF